VRKVYKFYKSNCPACYALERKLIQIGVPEDIEIIKLNVEDENNLKFAKSLGLNIVPALVFESNNKTISGKIITDELVDFLKSEG